MTKSAKAYANGIEITPNLSYTNWNPGFEYTKNILFKNLNTKTVKLTYKVPQTKYFTTLVPKIISLSPGTTFTLPVTFRPLEKVHYKDVIELHQLDFQKIVKIPISALLPEYKIDFQERIHFNTSSVFNETSLTAKITNKSELDTFFEFDVPDPFGVSPIRGELKPFESANLTFKFQPRAALVYKSIAVLKYGDMNNLATNLFKKFELHGTGKYPHILVEAEDTMPSKMSSSSSSSDISLSQEIIINFDRVIIGQTAIKYFYLKNLTEVQSNFHIERDAQNSQIDKSFNCLQEYGILQPFQSLKIAISYSPLYSTSESTFDYFNVFSSGNLCKTTITCRATSEAPEVVFDRTFLDFGSCNTKKSIFRTFNIVNQSSSKVAYQFEIDNEYSSFNFSVTNGTLEPNEVKLIQVTFNPQNPIIYYKKVFCIVENQKILSIDLMGSLNSELIKPPEIKKSQINLFYYLRKNNLLNNPPELLVELYNQKKILNDVSLDSIENMDFLRTQIQTTGYGSTETNSSLEEYLNNEAGYEQQRKPDDRCVLIDNSSIDFEATKLDANEVREKSIQVFNQTKGKLVLYWNSAPTAVENNQQASVFGDVTSTHHINQTFTISPMHAEIPPMKSYSFRIKFTPEKNNQFYYNKLEGYAFYKSLSDYTFAEPKFILPPWCLNIDCMGHTFHPSADEFYVPKYLIDNPEGIVFPVELKDKPAYRSFIIKNTSADYPLTYHFQNNDKENLLIKPQRGLIRKNEHQIFVMKYTPTENILVETCEFMLNYRRKNNLQLPVLGGMAFAELALENNGILYFAPTCKNNSSVKTFEIANLTPSKVNYEWKIPYESRKLFDVDCLQFYLDPYERKKTVWKFSPVKIDKYNHKVGLVTWLGDDQQQQSKKSYFVRLLGSCISGLLQSSEMYKDFGNVTVGSSISSELIIINNNDCSLKYELNIKQTTDESLQDKSLDSVCVLEFESYKGKIEARSKSIIRCRLRPVRLINYQFTIEYRIVYPNEDDSSRLSSTVDRSSWEVLCYMTAIGVYPKLNISDIKALGSASNLNKDYLWKLLSVNELNSLMSCEPNPDELIYSIATRQEANRRLVHQTNRPIIDLNFVQAPLNSDDSQMILFMQNTGQVPADWILLYPKDLLLELEYWAQNGEYTLEELEEMKVEDNKLFSIEPRKGHLEPQEIVQIKITFKYLFIGQSKLPILMKIAKGREIMLNLIGTTVQNGEPSVFFPSIKFEFEPVDIGLNDFPIQTFELYNGGDVPAEVEIDCSAIEDLKENNYHMDILKCMSDKVVSIPAGSSYETKWRFSPIEAKTYQVDILFRVNEAKYNVVMFKLVGYDKRKLNNIAVQRKYECIPETTNFTLPNQLSSLSTERILLGYIPVFTKERKVFFIQNHSFEHRISFTWHVTNPDHIRYIRIHPSRGIINTNESKMCKLTFISMGDPQFYNIDLICEVKNETEMDVYRKKIDLWKKEQVRQYEEFVIEENELAERLKKIDSITNESKENKIKPINKATSQLGIQKFKTIPPIIKSSLLEESNLDKARKDREDKKKWKKPQPPTPFLHHLNVIVTTQYLNDYLENSNETKNNSSKYVDSLLGGFVENESTKKASRVDLNDENEEDDEEDELAILINEEEKTTIEFVVSDILRSLVSDKSFHQLVKRVNYDKIPYFAQYVHDNNDKKNKKAPRALTPNESIEKNPPIKTNRKEASGDSAKRTDAIQSLKTSSNFGCLIETILENTLSNIMMEAFNREFTITNRPRLIALPPRESHKVPHTPQLNDRSPKKVHSSMSILSTSSSEITSDTQNQL